MWCKPVAYGTWDAEEQFKSDIPDKEKKCTMHTCKYCGKVFSKTQGLNGHLSHCKLNPNYNNSKDETRQNKALSFASLSRINKAKEIEATRQERTLKCKKCGKEYILNLTDKELEQGKYKKFCSKSCANTRILSKETKEKIKKSVQKKQNKKNYKYISELISDRHILNIDNYSYTDKQIDFSKFKKHKCVICGNEFAGIILKNGKIGQGTTCCEVCHKKLRQIRGKETFNKISKEGRFQGWKTRNILSYPENFWIKVLNNNNISYKTNFPIKQKNGLSNWFLDFYIESENRKIDLEIDGKQHKYKDRIKSDKCRDAYLKSLGYEVYRIDWNEIKTDIGKEKMKEKIDKFLEYIKQ